MKKSYQKPMVVIERFELSQHIAACDNKVLHMNAAIKDGCTGTANIGSMGGVVPNVFLEKEGSKCGIQFEDYCYASVTTGNAFLFQS